MAYLNRIVPFDSPAFSPLLLSDRLLTLAQDADRAGYRIAAEHLLYLATEVLDSPQHLDS
jgi:hypothetical protein